LTFGGAAVVEEPADPLAIGLAVANKQVKSNMEGVKIMDELQKQLAEAKQAAADAQAKAEKLEKSLEAITQEKEALSSELEESKSVAQKHAEEINTLKKNVEETEKAYREAKAALDKIEQETEAEAKANERCEKLSQAELGPKPGDEGYSDHFDRIKGLDDLAFEAMFEVLKSTAKASVDKEEEKELSIASKKRLPAGDTTTDGDDNVDFPHLRKLLGE
jgi:chromosome segregation ATPase